MSWFPYVLYALLLLSLARLIIGRSVYDRMMALTMVSAIIVVLMCVYAVMYEREYYLDVAMVYALLSFAEILAITRFVTTRQKKERIK